MYTKTPFRVTELPLVSKILSRYFSPGNKMRLHTNFNGIAHKRKPFGTLRAHPQGGKHDAASKNYHLGLENRDDGILLSLTFQNQPDGSEGLRRSEICYVPDRRADKQEPPSHPASPHLTLPLKGTRGGMLMMGRLCQTG